MAKKKEPEVKSEHVFTIPLRSEWLGTRRVMRAKRSVSTIRGFIIRNTRAKSVRISAKLNDSLWAGGAKNPPSRIRVKASVDSEGVASVKLPHEITLEEEKKKFLEEKKAKGKEEAKSESPDIKGEVKAEAAKEAATEPADKKVEGDMKVKEEPAPAPEEKG
ncbi:MAG: 60S ribosomal protein L31 [Candidatus Aenigmarchaeota archaeon]|nr:60S ribosomal protein L31 [Candidatus Aenigmarchaeota archaeon]